MKKKRIHRIIAIGLAILMLASVFFTVIAVLTNGSNAASDEMTELERQALELEAQQQNLADEIAKIDEKKSQLKGTLSSLNVEMSGIMSKKAVIDQNIDLTLQEIANLEQQIALLNSAIDIKRIEYDDAVAQEEQELAMFKKRMREMEENGDVSYYEALFDASSFGDFLSILDMIGEVMQRDEAVIDSMEEARAQVVLAQQALYDSKEDCEQKQLELEETNQKLQQERDEADAMMTALEQDIAAYTAATEENDALEAQIERELRETMAQAAAIDERIEKLQREESLINAGVNATGSYLWPSGSSYYVTSLFGERFHPVLKYNRMHYGIDIGAAYGTDIYASDGGIVVTSEYSSSYGNYVMLYHGDNRYTLYAHMTRRDVEVDDVVSQGDVIGLVGSTGYSTGPHIHFEIYEDGVRVDPLNYFANYVKYGC